MIKIKFKVTGPKQSKTYYTYFWFGFFAPMIVAFYCAFAYEGEDMAQFIGMLLWFFLIMIGVTGMRKHDSRKSK